MDAPVDNLSEFIEPAHEPPNICISPRSSHRIDTRTDMLLRDHIRSRSGYRHAGLRTTDSKNLQVRIILIRGANISPLVRA